MLVTILLQGPSIICRLSYLSLSSLLILTILPFRTVSLGTEEGASNGYTEPNQSSDTDIINLRPTDPTWVPLDSPNTGTITATADSSTLNRVTISSSQDSSVTPTPTTLLSSTPTSVTSMPIPLLYSTPTSSTIALPSPVKEGLSIGAKAGIGIGAGVGGLIIASASFVLGRRHNRSQKQSEETGSLMFTKQWIKHMAWGQPKQMHKEEKKPLGELDAQDEIVQLDAHHGIHELDAQSELAELDRRPSK